MSTKETKTDIIDAKKRQEALELLEKLSKEHLLTATEEDLIWVENLLQQPQQINEQWEITRKQYEEDTKPLYSKMEEFLDSRKKSEDNRNKLHAKEREKEELLKKRGWLWKKNVQKLEQEIETIMEHEDSIVSLKYEIEKMKHEIIDRYAYLVTRQSDIDASKRSVFRANPGVFLFTPEKPKLSLTDYMTPLRLQVIFSIPYLEKAKGRLAILEDIVKTKDTELLDIAQKNGLKLDCDDNHLLRKAVKNEDQDAFDFMIENGLDIDPFFENDNTDITFLTGLSKLSGRPAHLWCNATGQNITRVSYEETASGELTRLRKTFNFHNQKITTVTEHNGQISTPTTQMFGEKTTLNEVHNAREALVKAGGTPSPITRATGDILKGTVVTPPGRKNRRDKGSPKP